MEELGVIAFHTVVIMAALLLLWLALGARQAGELTPFDIAVSITAGTVAGAGVIDLNIKLGHVLTALAMIGLMQGTLSWLTLRYRAVFKKVQHKPTVVVENGQVIKANLREARLTAEMLLQLLRDKEVFDITEVELAIIEPTGSLSVLKKAEFLPLTASSLGQSVAPNRVLVPVVLEGELQEATLAKLGFSAGQIEAFRGQYGKRLRDVFIAFMDREGQMHVVREDAAENGSFLH
jgi:uncharacterized membrane protein YcaP (DUF421 family)